MQGCGNKDFCPFEEFKVNTAWPLHFFLKDASPVLSITASHFKEMGSYHPCLCLQEKIVKPHLKHDYNMICKIKSPAASEEAASFPSRVSSFFLGLFSQRGYRAVGAEGVKTEL